MHIRSILLSGCTKASSLHVGTEILEAYILTKFGKIFTLRHCSDTFPSANFIFLTLEVLTFFNFFLFLNGKSLASFLKLACLFKEILSKMFNSEASIQQHRKFLGMANSSSYEQLKIGLLVEGFECANSKRYCQLPV